LNIPEGYSENHHIHPTTQGGLNVPENRIRLTAREHFVAHLLLVKMNPGHSGLIHAAFRMSNYKKYGSRKYAWLRERFSIIMSVPKSDETRKKMSEWQKGIPKSDETRKRISIAKMGKRNPPVSDETRRKISQSKLGKKREWSPSDETRKKMSIAMIGKNRGPRTQEMRNNMKKGRSSARELREILKVWSTAL
jgi:hypothetical protein